MKAQKGSRGIAYSFFNLGGKWEWVVIATPRPLYPTKKKAEIHCTGVLIRKETSYSDRRF